MLKVYADLPHNGDPSSHTLNVSLTLLLPGPLFCSQGTQHLLMACPLLQPLRLPTTSITFMGCPRAGCAGWPWSCASARGRAGWCFVLQAAFLCSQLESLLSYGPRHPQRRRVDVPVLFNGTTAVLDAHVSPVWKYPCKHLTRTAVSPERVVHNAPDSVIRYSRINATLRQIKQTGPEFRMSSICVCCSLGKQQELAPNLLLCSSDSHLRAEADPGRTEGAKGLHGT